jgi:23S rRNA (guanosine2251-2'-O)-methyltransferase
VGKPYQKPPYPPKQNNSRPPPRDDTNRAGNVGHAGNTNRNDRPGDTSQLLYGTHIVEEMLKVAPFRIERLYLLENAARLIPLQQLAEQHKIPTSLRSQDALDLLTFNGNHQGVVARCGPFVYHEWETLLETAKRPPCFLILDSITDPQNLGTMLRSAAWFGIDGVVIPTDRAAPVTPAVIRASAGAALHAKIAQEVNLARVLDRLEEEQIMTYGAVLEEDAPMPSEVNLTRPCAIVIGAEDKGIRALLRKKCQGVIKIPGGQFESLNAAQAASILLYEVTRQRAVKVEDRKKEQNKHNLSAPALETDPDPDTDY